MSKDFVTILNPLDTPTKHSVGSIGEFNMNSSLLDTWPEPGER